MTSEKQKTKEVVDRIKPNERDSDLEHIPIESDYLGFLRYSPHKKLIYIPLVIKEGKMTSESHFQPRTPTLGYNPSLFHKDPLNPLTLEGENPFRYITPTLRYNPSLFHKDPFFKPIIKLSDGSFGIAEEEHIHEERKDRFKSMLPKLKVK